LLLSADGQWRRGDPSKGDHGSAEFSGETYPVDSADAAGSPLMRHHNGDAFPSIASQAAFPPYANGTSCPKSVGMGAIVVVGRQMMNMNLTFLGMAMTGLVGYLLDAVFGLVQRRVLWWKSSAPV
jgi:hypothetical protein